MTPCKRQLRIYGGSDLGIGLRQPQAVGPAAAALAAPVRPQSVGQRPRPHAARQGAGATAHAVEQPRCSLDACTACRSWQQHNHRRGVQCDRGSATRMASTRTSEPANHTTVCGTRAESS